MDVDRALLWQGGRLRLHLVRQEHEWRVAPCAEQNPAAPGLTVLDEYPPGDLPWRRWTVDRTGDRVRFEPAMPPRPIVVRPDSPVHIPPRHSTHFLVSVPVWVRVFVADGPAGSELQIADEPTEVLSNSWFGDPTQGIACYALRSRARRASSELGEEPCRAICPIEIVNTAQSPLFFERLCLQVGSMAIYRAGDAALWADAATVSYRGEEALSHVSYASHPPPGAGDGAPRIAAPRNPAEKSILDRTFANLRTFAHE